MCGIAGAAGFRSRGRGWLEQNVERMCKEQAHRGPDGSGLFFENGVCLGHRRLSILDLTDSGAQPMVSKTGRFVISYNGEIYNYKALAKKLQKKDPHMTFRGDCDTEVLLEACEKLGVYQTLRYAKGMFGFALYDRMEQRLILARDRIGEKPLYYGFSAGGFVFASEIGALRQVEGFHNPIKREILPLYLTYGYIPAPFTIYEGIYKLEAGTFLTLEKEVIFGERTFDPVKDGACGIKKETASEQPFFDGGGYQMHCYWSLVEAALCGEEDPFEGSMEEATNELEKRLKKSVSGQMVADVPLGAFLSGGIDSATVVSLMQSLSETSVQTFTIGFEEEGYDESKAAQAIAAHLGTRHTSLAVSEKEAKEVIPQLPSLFGEPFADSSQIPTYLVSRMTREQVTVSLSGDGGDELFDGYRSYVSEERIWNKMRRIPYGLRLLAGGAGYALLGGEGKRRTLTDQLLLLQAATPLDLPYIEQTREDLLAGSLALSQKMPVRRKALSSLPVGYLSGKELSGAARENRLLDLLMYHPDDILVKVDRCAMAVSLESRVPFLDRDVVEFALRLPDRYLREGEVGKKVLRQVLTRHVPKELMDRPKKGFSVPIEKWLRKGRLKNWAQELLLSGRIGIEGYLDERQIGRMWEEFTKDRIWRPQIWYVLMFEVWLQECGKGGA